MDPVELKEKLALKLNDFFINLGINPIYGVTVLSLIILLSYKKDMKRWEELSKLEKAQIASVAFAAAVLTIFSLLGLTGLINLQV
jgi:hypothetical protein